MRLIGALQDEAEALEGLSDLSLSLFLGQKGFTENGFSFMSIEQGLATFAVPPQECTVWYTEDGWPSGAKKAVAAEIAGKFDLLLYEPPDSLRKCHGGTPTGHHHFEFFPKPETQAPLAKVHPRYLQIRVVGTHPGTDLESVFQELVRFYIP